MKKPIHQRILLGFSCFLASIVAFGAVLDAVSNSISLITPLVTYLGTLAILVFWFSADIILSFRSIRWVTRANQEIRPQRLGWIPKTSMFAIVVLLWVPRVPELIKGNREKEFQLPELAVKLINKTQNDVQIQNRGDFVLWFPTGVDDGAPRVSGKIELRAMDREPINENTILIPAQHEQMILVRFLNAPMYRKIFEGEHTDLSLVIPRVGAAPVTMGGTIPFSKQGLQGGYVPITTQE